MLPGCAGAASRSIRRLSESALISSTVVDRSCTAVPLNSSSVTPLALMSTTAAELSRVVEHSRTRRGGARLRRGSATCQDPAEDHRKPRWPCRFHIPVVAPERHIMPRPQHRVQYPFAGVDSDFDAERLDGQGVSCRRWGIAHEASGSWMVTPVARMSSIVHNRSSRRCGWATRVRPSARTNPRSRTTSARSHPS